MSLELTREKILALIEGITGLPDKGGGTLQSKSVTPTKQAQTVTPDSGYDGLSEVGVGAIPDEYIIPSGTVSIEENGTYDVSAAAAVEVLVQGGGGDSGSDGGGGGAFKLSAAGSFTPSSDIKTTYQVNHGLGVACDFALVFADVNDLSAIGSGYMYTYAIFNKPFSLDGSDYGANYMRFSGIATIDGGRINSAGSTEDYFYIMSSSLSSKLKKGITYNWFCGVFADEQ